MVSSTNKTHHHDITEILLKVALNTINKYKNTFAKLQNKMTNFYSFHNTKFVDQRLTNKYVEFSKL
jgi:hypothetical protein